MKLKSHLKTYSIYKPLFQTLRLYYKYRKLALITSLLVKVLKIIENEIFKVYITELIS
jgi:hypothetical protein